MNNLPSHAQTPIKLDEFMPGDRLTLTFLTIALAVAGIIFVWLYDLLQALQTQMKG